MFKIKNILFVPILISLICNSFAQYSPKAKQISVLASGFSYLSTNDTDAQTAFSDVDSKFGTYKMVYPGAGIANSTGSSWGTSYSVTGSGNVALSTSPIFTTPNLGTPSALVGTNITGTASALSIGGNAATVTGLSIASGKTLTASNSLTLAGTDSTTMTFPSSSATIAGLGIAETWTALQEYNNGDLGLIGSSTGYTLLESGLSSSSNNTLTLPTTASDTLAAIGTNQTWTGNQYFDNNNTVIGSQSSTVLDDLTVSANSTGGITINSAAVNGGIDSNTKLMLHEDNNNTDSENTPKTITDHSMSYSNSIYKFGGYSASFNGSSSYQSTPANTDFAFGTNDFTFTCLIYPTSLPSNGNDIATLDYRNGNSDRSWSSLIENDSGTYNWKLFITGTSNSWDATFTNAITISTNSWHLLEADRTGGKVYFFEDGLLLNPGGTSNSTSIREPGGTFDIGATASASGNYFQGYIDEVKIDNGIARHTSNYTPPSVPFSGTQGVPTLSFDVASTTYGQIEVNNLTGNMTLLSNGQTGLQINSSGAATFPVSPLTFATPFTLGATSVTSTGTQLNYLNAATGTTGTTSTNVVFSGSPTIATPTITTSVIDPVLIGSTSANGTLTLEGNNASTGNTSTNANMVFDVGNSGGTTAMTILNNGNVTFGNGTFAISSAGVITGLSDTAGTTLSTTTLNFVFNGGIATVADSSGTSGSGLKILGSAATNGSVIVQSTNSASASGDYIVFDGGVSGGTQIAKMYGTGITEFDGHIQTHGTAPALTSCGTSPSIVGNDNSFTITVGSVSATGCTATFATAWTNAPTCTFSSQSALASPSYTVSNTAFTLSSATGLVGDVINVVCQGYT